MNKFFKCCLLTVVFIALTFSIPFSYCADSLITQSDDNTLMFDCAYKIISNENLIECNDAYYCDILGGVIEVQPINDSFSAKVLSTKRIKLKIDDTVISLSAHNLYSLSLIIQDNTKFLLVNETEYELAGETFTINFAYIGAFGNIKTEYFTTFHDKIIKLPVTEDLFISQGPAEIIDGDLCLYPEPISDASDTITQYIVYDSEFRLSYYSITNMHCVTETLSIDTDFYRISDDYKIVNVEPNNANATTEIDGNNIKFSHRGDYCITLTKNSYKYIINLSVNIPDTDDSSNPPEPDLPPDNGDNDNPDIIIPPTPPDNDDILPPDDGEIMPPDSGNEMPPDNEESPPDTELPPIDDNGDNNNDIEPPSPPDEIVPPDNNNNDNTDPIIPPDRNDPLPPDTGTDGDKTDGDITDNDTAPPMEEILPPNSDSSIIDDSFDFNINYESKIDYAKIIIVAVCAIFIIAGLTTFAVVISKIRKRK